MITHHQFLNISQLVITLEYTFTVERYQYVKYKNPIVAKTAIFSSLDKRIPASHNEAWQPRKKALCFSKQDFGAWPKIISLGDAAFCSVKYFGSSSSMPYQNVIGNANYDEEYNATGVRICCWYVIYNVIYEFESGPLQCLETIHRPQRSCQ